MVMTCFFCVSFFYVSFSFMRMLSCTNQLETFRRINNRCLVFVEVGYSLLYPQLQTATVIGEDICSRQSDHVFCGWFVVVRLYTSGNQIRYLHVFTADSLRYIFQWINRRVYFWFPGRVTTSLRSTSRFVRCSTSHQSHCRNETEGCQHSSFHLYFLLTQFKMIPIYVLVVFHYTERSPKSK